MTGMLYRLAAGLLCLGAIATQGQSSQHNAGDERGTLHYQQANMHLCPEDKWTFGEVPGLLPDIWFVANPSVRRTIGLSSVTPPPIRVASTVPPWPPAHDSVPEF